MSAGSGRAQEELTGSQLAKESERLSNRDLTAIIEQQEREIAALTEKLHSLASANSSPSPQNVPPSGSSLRALQRGLTTADDVRAVGTLCKQLVGVHWERLQEVFYEQVERARDALPKRVLEWEDSLPEDWYKDAWYLLYVQDMGVEEGKEEGDFDSLRAVLPYLKRQGFRNLCVLPHYESPMADGGYDVSRYETRESLGGEAAFSRFMDDAFEHGIRVATDGIFNHTSTEHEWFQRAVHGEEKYINYYVQRNGREKIEESDRDGDIICKYRDPDGTISERLVVFPDADRGPEPAERRRARRDVCDSGTRAVQRRTGKANGRGVALDKESRDKRRRSGRDAHAAGTIQGIRETRERTGDSDAGGGARQPVCGALQRDSDALEPGGVRERGGPACCVRDAGGAARKYILAHSGAVLARDVRGERAGQACGVAEPAGTSR
ncbi:maltose alpha-D-glucosyltransferase [Gracilaria domingensis]|nr:maltose alpha-D-glucosyltransferase [Gracilaria domingensis]